MKYQIIDTQNELLDAHQEFEGSSVENDGCFLAKGLIDSKHIHAIQSDILKVFYLALQEPTPADLTDQISNFAAHSEKLSRQLFSAKPFLRKQLIPVFRNLPSVQAMSALPEVLNMMKLIGLKLPVLRCNSLQVFYPWEALFNEGPHQDFGDMLSAQSWTLQVPLQPVDISNTGAAEIFPGTHKHGPLKHKLVYSDQNNYYHEQVDDKYWQDETPVNFDMDIGDVTFFKCLNIHQSSHNQPEIRWSLLLRYDDATETALFESGKTGSENLRDYDIEIWNDQVKKFFATYSL